MQDIDERDLGLQPLDKMMDEWGLDNHQLVEVSTEQLTHKQVQKARKGRRLTLKMMQNLLLPSIRSFLTIPVKMLLQLLSIPHGYSKS